MNLLEHYIKKVIKIEDCFELTTQTKFIVVTMEVECYGHKETTVKSYRDIFELNEELARGYFLA